MIALRGFAFATAIGKGRAGYALAGTETGAEWGVLVRAGAYQNPKITSRGKAAAMATIPALKAHSKTRIVILLWGLQALAK